VEREREDVAPPITAMEPVTPSGTGRPENRCALKSARFEQPPNTNRRKRPAACTGRTEASSCSTPQKNRPQCDAIMHACRPGPG